MTEDRYPPAPQRPREPRAPTVPPNVPLLAPDEGEPGYTRYRSSPRLVPRRLRRTDGPPPSLPGGGEPQAPGRPPWRRRITPRRVLLGVVVLVLGWIALSVVLFLASAEFEQGSVPASARAELKSAGSPLWTANNILVLGSDARPAGSKEPGAGGPSRSDTILLIRTGGGHAARLSIPRDMVVEIPGHGLQKVNAAYAFGGPALTISVLEQWLGIPINHVVLTSFANFPKLIDAMGGISYTGGCVVSLISGGSADGGYTLRLTPGTHHLNGQQALALARTRHNQCNPSESDLTREERQQKIVEAIEHQLTSPTTFLRLPLVAWDAPQAISSDMSGLTLLSLAVALKEGGSAPTRLLEPTGSTTLPDGEDGLTITQAALHADVARFMAG